MTTITRRRSKESGIRISDSARIPTLSEMIRDGQASLGRIKRSTREALVEWFAQSERLNIARTHYGLRGDRFRDFARRMGVDRSSAFELVKLYRHRAAIMSRCLDEQEQAAARGAPYAFPGWETALGWFEAQVTATRRPLGSMVPTNGRRQPHCSTSWMASSTSMWTRVHQSRMPSAAGFGPRALMA
jgi:hypothetical protein